MRLTGDVFLGISLTAEIPKTASGKILKRKLRELESAQQTPGPKL